MAFARGGSSRPGATALEDLLRHRLEHSQVVKVRNLQGGLSGAHLVEFDDGLRAVFKTTHGSRESFRHEVSLYRLDKLIGTQVVPVTTTRTLADEKGSLQLFIENSISAQGIIADKRKQLGLSGDTRLTHLLFNHAIAPPASPRGQNSTAIVAGK